MPELGVDLRQVQTWCCKPGCTRLWVHRHHKGNQLLTIKLLTKFRPDFAVAIARLEKQYKKFDPKEICRVCEEHHAEGHAILEPVIRWYFKEHGRPGAWKKLSTFMGLQKELQRQTDLWLKRKTPGLKFGFHSLESMKRHRRLRLKGR